MGEEGRPLRTDGARQADGTGAAGQAVGRQNAQPQLLIRSDEPRQAPVRARLLRLFRLRNSVLRRGAQAQRRGHRLRGDFLLTRRRRRRGDSKRNGPEEDARTAHHER